MFDNNYLRAKIKGQAFIHNTEKGKSHPSPFVTPSMDLTSAPCGAGGSTETAMYLLHI